MNVNEMTRKQFYEVPQIPYKLGEHVKAQTLIILPSKRKHDSGYRGMEFVLTQKGEPFGRIAGCSDVIHIDGIGGMGFDWLKRYGTCPRLVPPAGWSIDCLWKSSLLQMWPSRDMADGLLAETDYLSSFEVYADIKESRR